MTPKVFFLAKVWKVEREVKLDPVEYSGIVSVTNRVSHFELP